MYNFEFFLFSFLFVEYLNFYNFDLIFLTNKTKKFSRWAFCVRVLFSDDVVIIVYSSWLIISPLKYTLFNVKEKSKIKDFLFSILSMVTSTINATGTIVSFLFECINRKGQAKLNLCER